MRGFQTLDGFPGVPCGYRRLEDYLEALRANLADLEEGHDGRLVPVRLIKEAYRRTIADIEAHLEARGW